MNDLTEMMKKSMVKYDRKIKAVCAPLQACLGISVFGHFNLDHNGRFVDFCNHPEFREFYYSNRLFMEDPYISHPQLLRSGQVLVPNFYNPACFQTWLKAFEMKNLFIILHRCTDSLECSYFALLESDKSDKTRFFTQIDLLLKFISYFKREVKPLSDRIRAEGINMKQIKGAAFLEGDGGFPLSNKDPDIRRFLKLVMPLSEMERRCFDLFKKGNTAQMTGAILGISTRTVEFYFENIKNKLRCSSKLELMEWAS